MGIKRLGRKNLFRAEKLGKEIEVGTGAGLKGALVSATQMREGHKLTTDIVLDLASSAAPMSCGGTATSNPIGLNTADNLPSHICRLSKDFLGVDCVTEIRTVCLEPAVCGGLADFDIVSGSAGDGFRGSNPTGVSKTAGDALSDILTTKGEDKILAIDQWDANHGKDEFLYIGRGAAIAHSVASAKITLPATGSAFSQGSLIQLVDKDGLVHSLSIDKTANHAGSAVAHTINVGQVGNSNTDQAAIEATFKKAIEAIAGTPFGTVSEDGDGVTVPQAAGSGANGNRANPAYVVGNSSVETSPAVTVADFSGGTSTGKTAADEDAQFTAGKLLIRIVGFVAPDDV